LIFCRLIVILFAIPFTLVGVILAFIVTNITLSVVTFIGLIMLVGIVVNNGIVLVDYTNMLRKRNYSLRDAVMEGGLLVSVLVTLILIPTMYTVFHQRTLISDRASARLNKRTVQMGGDSEN